MPPVGQVTNWRKYIGARIATYSPASVQAWPKMIPNRNGDTRAPRANGPIAVRARLRVVFENSARRPGMPSWTSRAASAK